MLKKSDNFGHPNLLIDLRKGCELTISLLSITYLGFLIDFFYLFKKVLSIVYCVLKVYT